MQHKNSNRQNINQKGSILITALIVVTVLSFFCISIIKQIISYSNTTKLYLNNQKNETLLESAKNIGLAYVRENINEILTDNKFSYNKEIQIKDKHFNINIEWLEYPQKLQLSAGYITVNKTNQSQNYTVLLNSPFIYQFSAFENLEINCLLNSNKIITAYYGKTLNKPLSNSNNTIYFTPQKNTKVSDKFFQNSNYKYSLSEYIVEILDLEQYSKIADITLEENYIANRNFNKNIIYKNGDLILRNCVFDSCLLIVTGNLTIEDNFIISATDKYILETEQNLEIVENNNSQNSNTPICSFLNSPPVRKYPLKIIKSENAAISKKSKISPYPAIICGAEIFMNLRPYSSNIDASNAPNLSGLIFAEKKISIKNIPTDITNVSLISNNIKISNADISNK